MHAAMGCRDIVVMVLEKMRELEGEDDAKLKVSTLHFLFAFEFAEIPEFSRLAQ